MNWFTTILLIIAVIVAINLLLLGLNQRNLFFQVLCTFIYEHEDWKRYRRLKKYLKTNSIPFIGIKDYRKNNIGFAFIQYCDIIFVIQGDDLYLGSYYNHLIKDLLKRNNQ